MRTHSTRVTSILHVAAPGLKLDWDAVDGLVDSLGGNGVTSNYLFEMAPYTWSLVEGLETGRAVFTQPPMPIKCAGAPRITSEGIKIPAAILLSLSGSLFTAAL